MKTSNQRLQKKAMCQAENPATGRVCRKEVWKLEFDFLHLERHSGERREKENKMERGKGKRTPQACFFYFFLHSNLGLMVCFKFHWLGAEEMA